MTKTENLKIYILIGTRPNFVKVTQFKRFAARIDERMKISFIHTGQHYDEKMADVFFEQFNLLPDYYLNVVPDSPNKQIAAIMVSLENLVNKIGKPDLFLVTGDVNSTLAGALFSNKNSIKLGHIESGLRSFDHTMPEEHNRIITDYLSEFHFISEPSGNRNLINENFSPANLHVVGNTMIDTLVAFKTEIEESVILKTLDIANKKFVLMTMHRPSTVDSKEQLLKLIDVIDFVSQKYKIVFPMHPRTLKTLNEFGLLKKIGANKNLICVEPLDYFSFQKLIKNCSFVLTDSGGIQEETTYLQKPCFTFRSSTERPVTIIQGTNTLLDFDLGVIGKYINQVETGVYKEGKIPDLWDGKATERILKIIKDSCL